MSATRLKFAMAEGVEKARKALAESASRRDEELSLRRLD